jgi:outer membrane lipoprotein-sorting protein
MLNASRCTVLAALVFSSFPLFAGSGTTQRPWPDAREIIKRSAKVNNSDWMAQPQYSHEETDLNTKLNSDGKVVDKQEKAYRILMIEGSPYSKLIAVNGEPLSASQKKQEEAKLQAETKARRSESQQQRQQRIQAYKKTRSDEFLLMQQMTAAFRFTLRGEETLNGHRCYVLDATPDPNYQPPVQKARVLTGMKGRLWIDKDTYHWVRVKADVTEPVEFGLFIAKVRPGTSFQLDQAPVGGSVWLPSFFSQNVNARVLGFYTIKTCEEDRYSNYQRNQQLANNLKTGQQGS